MRKIPNINTHIFKQPGIPWASADTSLEGAFDILYGGNNGIFEVSGQNWNGIDFFDPGDAKMDIFAGHEGGGLYYLEQGANKDTWSNTEILTGLGVITSVKTGLWNSKQCVIVASKSSNSVTIHIPQTTPGGVYDSFTLATSKLFIQDIVLADIDGDGDLEIVFAWQGNVNGVGGISWLDYGGGTLGTDWAEHVMIQHDGAFWIADDIVDIDGDGKKELLFCARNKDNNSPELGIYMLEEATPITNAWTKTTIDNTAEDFTHVDFGNFFGNTYDIVAGISSNSTIDDIFIYDQGNSFAKTTLINPGIGTFNNNVKAVALTNRRSAIFVSTELDNFYLVTWDGSAWVWNPLSRTGSHHADNEILTVDLDGDGINETLIDDNSSGDSPIYYINVFEGEQNLSVQTPADLTNKVLWLNGDDITSSADEVDSWNDQFNSNDFLDFTSKPDLLTAELNGQNVVDFVQANNDELVGPVLNLTTLTFIWVFKYTATAGKKTIWSERFNGSTYDNKGLFVQMDGSNIVIRMYDGTLAQEVVNTFDWSQTGYRMLIIQHDATLGAGNCTGFVELDNVVLSNVSNLNPIAAAGNVARLGGQANVSSYDGEMPGLIITSDIINTDNLKNIKQYLRTRYNIGTVGV